MAELTKEVAFFHLAGVSTLGIVGGIALFGVVLWHAISQRKKSAALDAQSEKMLKLLGFCAVLVVFFSFFTLFSSIWNYCQMLICAGLFSLAVAISRDYKAAVLAFWCNLLSFFINTGCIDFLSTGGESLMYKLSVQNCETFYKATDGPDTSSLCDGSGILMWLRFGVIVLIPFQVLSVYINYLLLEPLQKAQGKTALVANSDGIPN